MKSPPYAGRDACIGGLHYILSPILPRVQQEQGHEQVQPLVVILQIQAKQLLNLLQLYIQYLFLLLELL